MIIDLAYSQRLSLLHRPVDGTETALLKVVNDILNHIEAGSVVALVSLDISAAFDMVNHHTLKTRLEEEFSISDKALEWICSYLQDMSSYVQVGSSPSATIPSMSGVPQGSVLGPFLFTAYVSPIGHVIDSFEVGYHSYADDTQLYAALRSTTASNFDRLSNCTAALQHWF